jgi:hypothetical protein
VGQHEAALHPLQILDREVQITADSWQRHVHERDADEVEERHRAQEDQGEPAAAGGEERGGGARCRHGNLGRRDARDLAVEFIASYQGTAVLTQALRQPALLSREGRRLERWIDSLDTTE